MGRAVFVVLLLLCGCQSAPAVYPSLRSPEATWQTFKQAWELGDVDVLRGVYGGNPAFQLRAEIETNGVAAVSEYYRKDFERARFDLEEWEYESDKLTYLLVVLNGTRLRYSFVRFGRYWKIVAFVTAP